MGKGLSIARSVGIVAGQPPICFTAANLEREAETNARKNIIVRGHTCVKEQNLGKSNDASGYSPVNST